MEIDTNNRILIVDDNVAIHQDFRKILTGRGLDEKRAHFQAMESVLFSEPERPQPTQSEIHYDMSFAFQASEALDMVTKAEEELNPYAIIFTDVRMPPGWDGVRLVEKVLQRAPFTEIVIITAFSDYSWEDLNQKFGWTDRILILRKPFDSITVKQIASTLTKKWELGYQTRKLTKQMALHLQDLEKTVEERTKDLRAAYQELQEFANIVAHDLRSPLAGIQGFSRELVLDLEDLFRLLDPMIARLNSEQAAEVLTIRDDRIPEGIEVIQLSTRKMDRLIKAVLNLAKLGHRILRPEQLDLNELVEGQLKTLAYGIEESGITVTVNALGQIRTDPLAMEQVLANLLSNAVKYSDRTRPGIIHVSAEPLEKDIVIHVRDNGKGIPEQHQERVFRIFQRIADPSIQGEGMGLAYVKALVVRMGGMITLSSKPGVGSTFSVRLPRELDPLDRALGG